jgi:hypothetical protein
MKNTSVGRRKEEESEEKTKSGIRKGYHIYSNM